MSRDDVAGPVEAPPEQVNDRGNRVPDKFVAEATDPENVRKRALKRILDQQETKESVLVPRALTTRKGSNRMGRTS